MTAITLASPATLFPVQRREINRIGVRTLAVAILVLSLFAVIMTPAANLVPESVGAAVSAVVPDSIENLLVTPAADALSFSIGWGVYIYLNRNDISWITSVGAGVAGSAICAASVLVSGPIGVAVCGAIAAIVTKIIVDRMNITSRQCLEVRIRFGNRYRILNNPC